MPLASLAAATPPTGGGSGGNLDFLPDWAQILFFAVIASIVTVVNYRKWQAGRGRVYLYTLWFPAALTVVVAVVVLRH